MAPSTTLRSTAIALLLILAIGLTLVALVAPAPADVAGSYEFVGMWPDRVPLRLNHPQGIAVDTSDTIFVADSQNNRIQVLSSSGTPIAKWGSYGAGDGEFNNPSGVTVDRSGNVYVSDAGNNRIEKFSSTGSFIAKWGNYGASDGQFIQPGAIAVDSSNTVYVADLTGRVQKFSSSGAFLAVLGNGGSQDGRFSDPKGIFIDSAGNIFVADTGNDRIQVFDTSGTFSTKWGGYGFADGQFCSLAGVVVDSTGNVFALDDADSGRIQKFSSSGTFLDTLGTRGSDDGEFYAPKGVAVDSTGNIFVADTLNDCIQKFDASGTFLTKWGGKGLGDGQFYRPQGIAVDTSGNVYVADTSNDRVQKFDSNGNFLAKWGQPGAGDGQFYFPMGIAVDTSGTVYIIDWNNRVQKFDASGTFLTKWGGPGSGDGQFSYPQGIGVSAAGLVYVADGNNNRIQEFSATGTFIAKWGTAGTGDGMFSQPFGIAVDSSGNVFVSDTGNNRVQKFNSSGSVATKWGVEAAGIAVDSWGNVFVTDSDNRVQKFAPVPTGSIEINGGSAATSQTAVQLELTVDGGGGSGVIDMRIAESTAALAGADYHAFSATAAFELSPGDGSRSVYAQFKDAAGKESAPVVDTIFLDTTKPAGTVRINGGVTYATATNVTINLTADDGAGSGVTQVRVSNDGLSDTETWMGYLTPKAWTLTSANGIKKVWVQVKDAAGNISNTEISDTIILDTVKPTATVSSPNFASDIGKTADFTVTWSGVDSAPSSGIASYDVQYKVASTGAWTNWKTATTAKSAGFKGKAGKTYYFRARAKDKAGNIGVRSTAKKTIVPFDNNSLITKRVGFAGTLSKASSRFYLGTVRYSKTKGDAITYKFTGNSVSLISTKAKYGSKAKIYIDGKYKKTVDTYSATGKYRQVVYSRTFTKVGTHTIEIVNVGNKSRLDVDGLGVGR